METEPAKVTPVRRRNTRAAIVAAAARVIAGHGVRGLRVEEVARAAGIATSLLYYYFEDRAALVKAALDHANEQAPTMLDDEGAADPARERLIAALLDELSDEAAVRDNSVVWNEVSASAVFEPALRADLQRVTDAWNAKVARTIRAGVVDGSIAGVVDVEATAERLTSLIEGLSLRWLAGTLSLERARELLEQALRVELPAG
jgi:AcrR family transcriptional regulator